MNEYDFILNALQIVYIIKKPVSKETGF